MTDEGRGIARRLGLKRATGEQYYRRGLQTYESGDLENAILDLSEAIYYDRDNAEYYATRGLFFLEQNRKDEAELDLGHALKLNKRLWLPHYGLGILRFQEGAFDAALEHFDLALKRSPNRPEVWFYRAVTCYHRGHDQEAARDIDRAIQYFSPSDAKRLKEARAWKREIGKHLPQSSGSKPASRPKSRSRRSASGKAPDDADQDSDESTPSS